MLSISSHQCGEYYGGTPPKTSHPPGAARGQAGCQTQPLSQHPCGQEQPWGYVREQVWAVLRLPAPACTRPTPVSQARAAQVSILGKLVRSGDKLPSVYLI